MDKQNKTAQRGSGQYDGFFGKTCMILGITQVIAGVCCMVINGIGIYFNAHLHDTGQGIWSGTIFFVCGVACVITGHLKTTILVKITFVLCIASILSAIAMLGITAAGMDFDRRQDYNFWIKDYTGSPYLDGKNDTRKAAHIMLLMLSLVELLLAVFSLLICIHGIFYCNVREEEYVIPAEKSLKSEGLVRKEEVSAGGDGNRNESVKTHSNPFKQAPVYTDQTPGGTHEYRDMTHLQKVTRPPVFTGGMRSSPFQPLHLISDSRPASHSGSHNTTASSFTPLHMIHPEYNYNIK